jgi:DNA repair exonuclease SbcCD ATPase subunit
MSIQGLLSAVSGFTSNIVFYDEVFDHLDSTGRELMLELLHDEAERRDTVFVITQEPSLKDYFPHRILVRKEKGISRLQEVA